MTIENITVGRGGENVIHDGGSYYIFVFILQVETSTRSCIVSKKEKERKGERAIIALNVFLKKLRNLK